MPLNGGGFRWAMAHILVNNFFTGPGHYIRQSADAAIAAYVVSAGLVVTAFVTPTKLLYVGPG